MKKFVFLLMVLITGIWSFGQSQPNRLQPARLYLSALGEPMKYYTNESMMRFLSGNNARSTQFKDIVLWRTGETDLSSLFQKIRVVKDMELFAGSNWNSGWDPVDDRYRSFRGKYYKGDVTVYDNRYGEELLLWKNNCDNFLGISTQELDDFYQGYQEEEKQVVRQESYKADLRSDLRNELTKPIQSQQEDWPYTAPKKVPETTIDLNLPPVEEASLVKKQIKIGWIVIPFATILTGGAAYLIVKNNIKKPSPDNGHGQDPPDGDDTGHGQDPPDGGG